jgi:hypothetical protein
VFKNLVYCVSFLCLINSTTLYANEIRHSRYKTDLWERLIFFHNGAFQITDRNFLLSHKNPSVKLELSLTIKAMKNNPSFICKYPARYKYLTENSLLAIQDANCPNLKKYRENVIADKFYYIFASKNFTSVTSFMGHSLLAVSGTDLSGKERSHAYTFFANLYDVNIFTLLYDAFIGGLEGVFALSPLSEKLNEYLDEGREIWRLELNIPQQKRALLRDSLWELKDVKPEYFLHDFNCATIIYYSLGIVLPDILASQSFFTSPVDIYKSLQIKNYIKNIQIQYKEDTFQQLGKDYSTVQPSLEMQDSSIGVYYKDGVHLTFMGASHRTRTPQIATIEQTKLKIGEIDFNITKNKIENFSAYEYLDLPRHKGLSSHLFVGASRNDYTNYDKLRPNAAMSFGSDWQYGKASFSVLAGARVQAKDLVNPILESFSSYKFNDYTTFTLVTEFQTNGENELYKTKALFSKRVSKNWVIFAGYDVMKSNNFNEEHLVTGIDYHF